MSGFGHSFGAEDLQLIVAGTHALGAWCEQDYFAR
jgi:hypothetical protein